LSAFVGSGDFKAISEELFGHLRNLGGLKPSDSILDVGCRIGRVAVPLTQYLDQRARYEGFDVVKKGIDWCRENISQVPQLLVPLRGYIEQIPQPDGHDSGS